MIKYSVSLLFSLTLILAGCTPTIIDTQSDGGDKPISQGNDEISDNQAEGLTDGKPADSVSFNEYNNPAVGYMINIPTNWYWQHFHKAAIGADSTVDDYLLISPTHVIAGLATESPAEIIVEVSSRAMSDFSQAGEQETAVTVAGQSGVKVSTIVNNEVFDNFQKIEYRFTRNGQTYRLVYLANDGLDNNEAVFEQIVASLKFAE